MRFTPSAWRGPAGRSSWKSRHDPQTQARMLGCTEPLTWDSIDKGILIHIPETPIGERPCRNAWVFKMTGLAGIR